MNSRFLPHILLFIVALFVTGCSSTKMMSSVEPVNTNKPYGDVDLDEISVDVQKQLADKDEETQNSLHHEWISSDEQRVPRNVVKLNVGASVISSSVEAPSHYYDYKMGLDYGVEYHHFWRSGFGLGASFNQFNTSFGKDYDLEIRYVGPLAVYSDYLDSKGLIRGDFEFGVGCGFMKEKGFDFTNTQTNFAAMIGLGVEYSVAKNVAFGVQFNWNSLYMFDSSPYYMEEEDMFGIKRWGLLTGIRVWF